ncbi:MAG TPA: hypothetical protein VEB20_21190 [Azospirillaceae bacterium]|nr:hypothetical protein [Azospirillaceae bacterium]
MTPDRFEELLDLHGPDLSAWPAHLRGPAEALLAAAPAVQEAHRRALRLETLLADLPLDRAGPALRRAVLDIPLDHPLPAAAPGAATRLARAFGTAWRQWTAGIATATASALLGVVLGAGGLTPFPVEAAAETLGAEMLDAFAEESGEVAAAMLGDAALLPTEEPAP